jgi:hypothetical protein
VFARAGATLPHPPHTPSDNRGSPLLPTRPQPARPPAVPGVPAVDTGTQPAKPLGITGCPAGHWTNKSPLAKAETRQGPQRGVCDARRVCVTHSHFWAKIVTPVHPSAHPRPPLSTYDAHLVNKGKQKVRKGVHRVAGCWSLGAGVSRPKPIGDYGYPWILILIHIRPNP